MDEENVSTTNEESPVSNLASMCKGLGAGLVPVRSLEDSVTEFTKGLSDPKLKKSIDALESTKSKSTFLPEAVEAVKRMKLHAGELGERASLAQGLSIPKAIPDYSNPMEKLTNAIAEVSAKLDRLLEAQGL